MKVKSLAAALFAVINAGSANAAAPTYSIQPGQLSPGNSYTLTVAQNACTEGGAEASLKTAVLVAKLTGLSISTRPPSTLGCSAAWQAEVGATAPLGPTSLQLLDKEGGSVLALLKVDIVPVAGPTPPGLERQVDVMWKVLPYRNVADSFGKKVAIQYFAIQLTVGNNSGYPIQLSAVGFKALQGQPPLPNDPYNFARSTIEREQQVGSRALFRHGIEAVAGLATGVTGFMGPRSKDDYGLALGFFNPLATGFDLVWPDKTVRHLIAMDSRAFRDGIIVANNVPSSPILAFVSRETVECNKKPKTPCGQAGQRLAYRGKEYDPVEVMGALGELVLEGSPIRYLPRVSVAGNRVTPAPVPAVLGVLGSDREVRQGATGHTLRIPGNGLQGADVAAAANSGITIKSVTPDAHGTSISVVLDVADDAPTVEPALAVSTGAGPSQITQIKILPATPRIDSVAPSSKPQAGQTSEELTVQGKFLKGAKFQMGATELTSAPSGAGFKVTIPLDPLSAPRKVAFTASRNGVTSAPATFELAAAKPELEAARPASANKDGAAAPVEVRALGNFLNGVKVEPPAGSGLVISDVRAAAVAGQSKREELVFKADVRNATKGKHKLTIRNGGESNELEFEVK